ncbi:MAG: FliH/SctL family protein [Desulfonatronovibrio sp.]
MSLSDAPRKIRGGRVIMGLRTRDLEEVNAESRQAIRIDTPETEARFLERVREKARQKASEIINQAMTEAKAIKHKAAEEGRTQGMTKADQEIQATRNELSSSIGKVISSLKNEKDKIRDEYRQDMVLVLRASVEKILGLEIQENRINILESLLDQSLDLAESNKKLTLTVSPDDEQILKELLENASEKHPVVEGCRVKSSAKIKKGGLILENGNGMVDNTLDSRYEQIKKIVEQVSLAEDDS